MSVLEKPCCSAKEKICWISWRTYSGLEGIGKERSKGSKFLWAAKHGGGRDDRSVGSGFMIALGVELVSFSSDENV